jgi:hypothetical protein
MDIGTLVMKINADTTNAEKGINGFKSVIKGVGGIALGAGALVGGVLAAAIADGTKGLMAMEDQTAQLDAVLKSTKGVAGVTAEEVTKLAEAYQLSTKFAAESVLEGQNLLLTFTKIGADVFPQATETMLNMATAMGTDASSQAIALGKALNDPVAGVASLTRVGVQFTDEQKKTIETMVAMGDVAGAQKVILAELETQFGGSAEAAGKTFSGQLEIAKNAVGEISESLASQFMPVLQGALDWIVAHLPEIQAFFQTAFDIIGTAIGTVVTWFKTYMLPILDTLFKWVSSNMPIIQAIFKTVFDASVVVIKTLWTFIQDNLLPIIKAIFDSVGDKMPKIQKIFKEAFGVAKDVTQIMWDVFKGMWEFLEPTMPLIGAIIETAMDVVITTIETVVETIKTLIGWIKDAIEWFNKLAISQDDSEVGSLQSGLTAGLDKATQAIEITAKKPIIQKQPINFDKITGQRAFGGPVMGGSSYLVGERGPEIFTPSSNGRISSNNNITINVNGSGDPDSIASKIVSILKLQGVK